MQPPRRHLPHRPLDVDDHVHHHVDHGASWVLRSIISARGNTAPVELTIIEASANPSGLTVRATGKVDRYAHDITKLKGMAARYLT